MPWLKRSARPYPLLRRAFDVKARGVIRRRAFTLIELISAVGAMSVIVLAMGSVLMLAQQAVPEAGDRASSMTSAWGAAERFANDLSTATSCASSAGTWTLTLPDRDANGVEETVVWTWDSTGSTRSFDLTRQHNSDPAVTMLSNAKSVSTTDTKDTGTTISMTITIVAGDDAGTTVVLTTPVWNLPK